MAVGRNTSNAIDGHFSKNNRKIMKDINVFLEAFKAKKEQQKQREKEQKKKAAKAKQAQKKRVGKLKKELFLKQLINTHVKPFEKPPKPEHVKNIPIVYVGDFNEETLFTIKDELQQWEAEHWPCINWDKWDELVEKGRKEILKQ